MIPIVVPQALPQDIGFAQWGDVLLDAGYFQSKKTIFHSIQINRLSEITDMEKPFDWLAKKFRLEEKPFLYFAGITGILDDEEHGISPFFFGSILKDKFYAQLYLRATNNSELLNHYSGIPRNISRFGFNSAEIDRAVIGFQNGWIETEFGRNREIWGISNEYNLILSGNSPAYERFVLQLNSNSFSYRYFYGFLESKNDAIGHTQRYLVGRGLEYRRGENLVVGVGEVSILTGVDRPFDWAFANPFGFHLEVENNQRSNEPNGNRENAIWFLHADWFPLENLRLAGSAILDEFQLDSSSRKKGRGDALGFLFHGVWSPIQKPVGVTILADWVRIGTFVYQHEHGNCNFVTRDQLLGHLLGNDVEEITGGARFVFQQKFIIETKIGARRQGVNSLYFQGAYTPFDKFNEIDFPSGMVENLKFLRFKIDAQLLKIFHFRLESELDLADLENSISHVELEVIFR